MEYIVGKSSFCMEASEFEKLKSGYREVLVDVGTGDGRFVLEKARQNPHCLVIGVDACRENLVEASRKTPPNALFVIANVEALPEEMEGLATAISINFPWGSLLKGLLEEGSALPEKLAEIARPGARLEICLNNSALLKEGYLPEKVTWQILFRLRARGFKVYPPLSLDGKALRALPSSWAKRLAYGNDPHALLLVALVPESSVLGECLKNET